MIYVNFDKYGVLNHIEYNDEVIFKGNNNVNKVFVCFDGIELKPQHYLTYSALINDKDYSGNLTDLASVRTTFNGKDGYMFSIFSNLTKDAGTLKLSVRLVDRLTDAILVSGILPLIVQDSAVSTYSNVNITTTQYQALLTAFDDLSQTFNETNFKTINEESLFGEGNITLPTIEDVDALDTSLKEFVNDNITNLSYTDEELRNQINEQNKIIENQDKRIKVLELASEGNILNTTTEDGFGYKIDVSSDILPFVEINKIGGMTYKSDNELYYDDLEATTINGLTYHVENGIIYLNGTLTTKTAIQFNLTKPIVSGTYSYKNLGNGISDSDSRLIMYKLGSGGSTSFVEDLLQNTTDTLNLSQEADVIKFSISAGTYTNATIKPMLVKGTTIPTKFIKGFEGLRNSAVNQVVVKGANLQKTNWSGINSTIELSETLKAGQKYTISIFITKKATDYGINIYEENNDGNNLLFNASYTNWAQPNNGWNSFVITPIKDTNYLRINCYGIIDEELKGAVLKGALVEEKKWVNANLYKPYKEPTTYTIPTSIDGYDIGIDETYHNYVDFQNKKFVKNVETYTFTGNEWFGITSTNATNINRIYTPAFESLIKAPQDNYTKGILLISDFNTITAGEAYAQVEGVAVEHNKMVCFFKKDIQTPSDMANYLKGKTIYFALATPIETDLSDSITDDFIVEIEANGTITFDNQYKNDIPYGWTYQEKL